MKTGLVRKVIFIMGVSGSGKTSIGRLVARESGFPFVDADDHHPLSNIEKMSRGIPLVDSDRVPWLDKIHAIAISHVATGCVIACSALKEAYRKQLVQSIEQHVLWIYLKGSYEQVYDRMIKRKDHFMDPALLRSQFETLEEPQNAIAVDITDSPEVIIRKIQAHLA